MKKNIPSNSVIILLSIISIILLSILAIPNMLLLHKTIIMIVASIVILIGYFVIVFQIKKKQKIKEDIETEEIANNIRKDIERMKEEANPITQCAYCGSSCLKTDKKCPNCGASIKK